MYCPGVEVLLWGGCYVLSWCGGAVVARLLCTVLVWRCCCGESAMYCPGVEDHLCGFHLRSLMFDCHIPLCYVSLHWISDGHLKSDGGDIEKVWFAGA